MLADQCVHHPILRGQLGPRAHVLAFSLSRLCDCDLDEIAHNLLHVAADVAHLGELGRFYLHEWSPGEPGESAGNLGFADAGRADHENIFGKHLFAHLLVELQAAPPVAQCNRHRPFRIGLADDEAIELGDDLARRKVGHALHTIRRARPSGVSTMRSLRKPALS